MPLTHRLIEEYWDHLDKALMFVKATEEVRGRITSLDMAIAEQQRQIAKTRRNQTNVIKRQNLRAAKEANVERQDLIAECQWKMQQANMYSAIATAIAVGEQV